MTNPKIALAQMDVVPGKWSSNLVQMKTHIQEAIYNKYDMICFPEMCVGGYLLGDRWTETKYCQELESRNEAIASWSKEIAIVWGNVRIDPNGLNNDGRVAKYNTAFIAWGGKLQGFQDKTLLPNYRIFDDKRYFRNNPWNSDSHKVFDVPIVGKVGLEVCEDLWWEDYGYCPTEHLVARGAEVIVNISSSPYTKGKSGARDRRVQGIADMLKKNHGWDLPLFCYVNCVGMQDNGKNIVLFDGDSCFYENGKRASGYTQPFTHGTLFKSDEECKTSLYTKDTPFDLKLMDVLIYAFQKMDKIFGGFPTYVYGLSGGIDSAVSCALATIALGKDRVKAYNMPSKWNSAGTKEVAARIADALGIEYHVVPIEGIQFAVQKALVSAGYTIGSHPLLEENLQAKIRYVDLLSNLAQMHNGVMTNNGNKLEVCTGYFTVDGDGRGSWCPLGDLLKTEVFQVAREINERMGQEIIPNEIIMDMETGVIPLKPSAELSEGQSDPFWFGFDDAIINLVMNYNCAEFTDILGDDDSLNVPIHPWMTTKYNLNDTEAVRKHITWLFKRIQDSTWKRVQAPPILMLSKNSEGYDKRRSIQC